MFASLQLWRTTWIPAFLISAGFLFAAPPFAIGQEKDNGGTETKAQKGEEAKTTPDTGVVKRGAAIGDSPTVALADVIKNPDKFADKSVIFQGTIAEVCQKKGCWMKVLPMEGETGVRVTFLDYGFFVPKDSKGMLVRAEGTFHTKVWSKEDAEKQPASQPKKDLKKPTEDSEQSE
jgi:hypothetical protein